MTKKPDKKQDILDAMLDLVVKRGFHDAPMSLLAKKSGASAGVIYHYFPNKDGLIRALFEHIESIKHEAFFKGHSDRLNPREALLQMWFNAYDFYRTHAKEARFLEQYLSSPYCKTDDDQKRIQDPAVKQVVKWLRPKKHGGLLKDLPPEAIDSLTLGLAATLAKSSTDFPKSKLKEIAETVWTAIADQ
jgi:TetR/AcrR family transcriptional regulator, repressor of fatR-cypB operon